MSKKTLVCFFLCLIFFIAGCSSTIDAEAIADYASEQIVISGLTEQDFVITVNDLAALQMVERSASTTRSNGQEVHIDANGPLLDTFLSIYGKNQTDFSRIRFTATDDYSIAVTQDVLAEREIVLALGDGGNPLSEDDIPVRVVIPGERAMYWVRHLCRIDFENDTVDQRSQKIVFLEKAASLLPSSDYEYYGEMDQVVSVKDLFDTFINSVNDADKVELIAADGLEKTETIENFLKGDIKYTGSDSPRFVSQELPEGMQVYDLVWIGYSDTRFVSLPLLLELNDSEEEMLFSDLIRSADFVNTDSYYFTSADGSSVTLNMQELSDANFAIDENGCVKLSLSNGENPINDLLSIEEGQ